MDILSDKSCFYCANYNKWASDYPVNEAEYDKNTLVPRCPLHWKYGCFTCNKNIHFNGISWCSDCQVFTCIECGEEKKIKKRFFSYNYYYEIACSSCGIFHPALDYSEYNGNHPYQIGDLVPEEQIQVWMPIYKENFPSVEIPNPAWGTQLIEKYKYYSVNRIENIDKHEIQNIWDKKSSDWVKNWPEGGDINHKYIILPEVFRLLNIKSGDKVLDLGCGEGTVARYLAKNGAHVTAIDFSNMISYAIKREKKEKKGINYIKMNAYEVDSKFDYEFDSVVSNMAIMDMEDYERIFEAIYNLLKNRGIFVFSITHPIFSVPVLGSIRIPKDSQRNEDKVFTVDNYFDNRPALLTFPNNSNSLLYFHRTLSQYINSLSKNNLFITEISEPRPSEELINKFPRDFYYDYERTPPFIIFKTIKREQK